MGSPNGNKETMDELGCKRKHDALESGEASGRVDAGKLAVSKGSKGKTDGRVDGGKLAVSEGFKGKDDGRVDGGKLSVLKGSKGKADGRVDGSQLSVLKSSKGRADGSQLSVSKGSKGKAGGRVDGGQLSVLKGSKGKVDGKAKMPSQAAGENTESDDADKLIACKTCSQTYHVKCVSLSSLECIPEDWNCLNCTDDIDLLEPLINFKRLKKDRHLKPKCLVCSPDGKKRCIIIPEDKDIKSLLKSTSTHLAESDDDEIENQEEAAVSDPSGIISKHTLEEFNNDKLLMLSEACDKTSQKPALMKKTVEKSNKPDKKGATTQQPDQETLAALHCKIERLANLRKRQREKASLRKKSEVTVAANSTAVIQKKSYDLQIVEKDNESVAFMNDDPKTIRKAGETGNSASKGLLISGQDKTPPSTSSHLKNGSECTASGSKPTRSVSIADEGADTTTRTVIRKPSGLLVITKPKSKEKPESNPEPVTKWDEFELDSLWIGVRRHGQGNWEKILRDPTLFLGITGKKTPEDLSKRWEIESQKIFPPAVASTSQVPQPQPQPLQNNALERNNNNNNGGGYTMMVPAGGVVPHNPNNMPAAINWYPCSVENQGIMWMPFMPNAGGPSNVQGFSSSPSMISQMASASAPQRASTSGDPFNIPGSSSTKVFEKASTSTPQRASTQDGPSYFQGSPSSPKEVSKKARTSASPRAPTPAGSYVLALPAPSAKVSQKTPKSPANTPQRATSPGGSSYAPVFPVPSSNVSEMLAAASGPLRPPPPPPRPTASTNSSMTSLLAAQLLAAAGKTTQRSFNPSMIPKPLPLRVAPPADSRKGKSVVVIESSSSDEENDDNEPKLLLGGCFTLPKVVVFNKKNDANAATASSNKNDKGKGKEPAYDSDDSDDSDDSSSSSE